MKWFLYLKRNPRQVLALFICSFLALFSFFILELLGTSLDTDKESYIEVYKSLSVITPRTADYPFESEMIPIRERGLPVKLVFGTGRLPLFEVNEKNSRELFGYLGFFPNVTQTGVLYINRNAFFAVQEAGGLPENLTLNQVEFLEKGPKLGIRVVEEEPSGAYAVPASFSPDHQQFWVQDYAGELQKVRDENIFVNNLMKILNWTVFFVLSLGTGTLVFFNMRSRIRELSILQVIGYSPRLTISMALAGYSLVILTGSFMGGILGWAAGMTLIQALIPGGMEWFWPGILSYYFILFPLGLLLVGGLVGLKTFLSQDPIVIIEKAGEII